MTPTTDPNSTPARDAAQRAGVRRTVWILGTVAIALFAWTLFALTHPA